MNEMKRKIGYSSILLVLLLFLTTGFSNVYAMEITDSHTNLSHGAISRTVDTTMNSPPNPPEITGPTSGIIDQYYTYNFTLTDPEGDVMFNLEIDWGDGTDSIDCGCGKSWQNGTVIPVSHRWKKQESYAISARVSDSYGHYSNWSDPLVVSMPKQHTSALFSRFSDIFQQFTLLHTFSELSKIFQ